MSAHEVPGASPLTGTLDSTGDAIAGAGTLAFSNVSAAPGGHAHLVAGRVLTIGRGGHVVLSTIGVVERLGVAWADERLLADALVIVYREYSSCIFFEGDGSGWERHYQVVRQWERAEIL